MTAFAGIVLSCSSCGGAGGAGDPQETAEATLQITPGNFAFTYEGGTNSYRITASGAWSSSCDASWLTVSPASGSRGEAVLTIAAEANPEATSRSAVLSFSYSGKSTDVTVTQTGNPNKVPVSEISVPDGYHLVWNDEFDTGSTLNTLDWTHEVQKSGWVNNELQNYVNRLSPGGNPVTEIVDGALNIHCFNEDGKVYSGRVYAKVGTGWQYGWFEARINLPSGKGTWPAFWMMPVGNDWSTNPWPKCGEIDIMEEVGVVPNEVSSSIHTQDYNHTKNTQKTHAMTIAGAEGEFHVYALEWTEDAITTYVDGKVQLAVTREQLGSSHDQWPFAEYPFYPILNLAWGGSWGGMNGVDESALPVTMKVDYVRVFQKD